LPNRTQHEGFGNEIRALLGSTQAEEQAIAGIITDELEALDEAVAEGRAHPNLQRLTGDDLREIQYLELYKKKQSIRVYFTVIDGWQWMLAINHSKRRTAVTEGMKERLISRLREAKQEVKAMAEAAKAAKGCR
jgi:hypothetical protein